MNTPKETHLVEYHPRVVEYFQVLINNWRQKIEDIMRRENMPPTMDLEAIVIFGSSMHKTDPNDVDFLIVSDSPYMHGDIIASGYFHQELEYNGRLGSSLNETEFYEPFGDKHSSDAIDFLRRAKAGKEALVIITRNELIEKYRTDFPSAKVIDCQEEIVT